MVAYIGGVDSLFNALGDPTRVAIVEELAARDRQSLFELCTRLIDAHGLSSSRQAVAKHIAVLRDAGIVNVEQIGRTSVHSLDRSALERGSEWLDTLTQKGRPS